MLNVVSHSGKFYIYTELTDVYVNGIALDKGWNVLDEKPSAAVVLTEDKWVDEQFTFVTYSGFKPKPAYVLTEFPYWINSAPELWYKFPCRITAESVFGIILDTVRERCDGIRYILYDFPQLGYFKVYERMHIPFTAYEKVLTIKDKKKKWVNQKKTHEEFLVLHMALQHGKDGATPVTDIHGDDYTHLQERLREVIEDVTDAIDVDTREICRHCLGLGVVNAV